MCFAGHIEHAVAGQRGRVVAVLLASVAVGWASGFVVALMLVWAWWHMLHLGVARAAVVGKLVYLGHVVGVAGLPGGPWLATERVQLVRSSGLPSAVVTVSSKSSPNRTPV